MLLAVNVIACFSGVFASFTVRRFSSPFYLSTIFFQWAKVNLGTAAVSTKRNLKKILGELKLLAKIIACENSRFSSFLAAGDVSGGGTSATQRQKRHTDDVKSVRNPVTSADWTTVPMPVGPVHLNSPLRK